MGGTTPVLYTEKWAYAPIGAYRGRELYDLEADPYAEANVASEHAETVQDLHESFWVGCAEWAPPRRLLTRLLEQCCRPRGKSGDVGAGFEPARVAHML